ncbi:MAG: phage holin family protein [Leucobacter sp.]
MRTVIRILVSAFALWLTTLIVGGNGNHGVWIQPLGTPLVREEDGVLGDTVVGNGYDYLVTLLLVALIFGLVNGTLGKIVRVVSFPLYILTLGLFSLIVNGFLLVIVAWISDFAGFGLRVDGFWWGVLAAFVMSLLSSIMNGLLGTGKRKDG